MVKKNHNGQSYVQSQMENQCETKYAKFYINSKNEIYLSPRELDCLEWYAKGKNSTEIAMILRISRRTVETHVQHIKEKLTCNNLFQMGYLLAKIQFDHFGFISIPWEKFHEKTIVSK